MSLCAVMLVRDEADIVEVTVRHLLENVDEVIVADNISTDGTYDLLLEAFGRDERVLIQTDSERGYYQARKTTALAMLALERGHRWVIPCDADEFWYAPDGRPIRDWLDGLGREIQFVKAVIYNHVASALDDPADLNPVTRIGYRQRTHLEMRWGKVACRLRPDLEIDQGNHSARTRGVGTTAHGLELRHFPYRGPEHFTRKAINGYAAYAATDLDEGVGSHWRVYGRAIEEGGEEAGHAWFYDAFWSADPQADSSLVYDPAPVKTAPSVKTAVPDEIFGPMPAPLSVTEGVPIELGLPLAIREEES